MRVGNCPSCRAPIDFAPGAGKVKVCEHCNTVVLRGEANLEKLGKVAELVDTDSPLKLGLSGLYSGNTFTIVGRVQKENKTGTWDEWCLQFEDERTAWLSESEGAWNIMFLATGAEVPALSETTVPLNTFMLRGTRFTIEERNEGSTVSAEGQLPDFSRKYTYLEATGPRGVFVSIEYTNNSDGEAWVGNSCTLKDLGFDPSELQPAQKRQDLKQARCTECNGMLALKAPDATKRVGCPYCGALLNVRGGQLEFLELLEQGEFKPVLALGTTGTIDKTKWTVIAYLRRSCDVDGTNYPWEEYLLWHQPRGFTWLMCSNNHWTWLQPIAAGELEQNGRAIRYNNNTYRQFQYVYTRTDYVIGECYWAVTKDEKARASEYVHPPFSVNIDETDTEITATFGTMMSATDIRKAFNLKTPLREPGDIAPAQVNPWEERATEAWKWTGIWALALLAVVLLFWIVGSSDLYLQNAYTVPPGVAAGTPDSQIFTDPFVIKHKVPLEVTLTDEGLQNQWLGTSVDLVNQDTGEVISVYNEASYYSGVEGGESWSEGSHSSSKQTADIDPGTYVARITPQFEGQQPMQFAVKIQGDDRPGLMCPLVLLLMMLVVPVFSQMKKGSFETRRWNESVFQSYWGHANFPYAKVESDDE